MNRLAASQPKHLTVNQLLEVVKKINPEADLALIRLAYDFAADAHQGQERKSGEPYIQHSLYTALTLAQWGLDDAAIAAALLHDVPEDTAKTLKDVEREFGKEIRELVEGITKLGMLKYRGMRRYVENLRRMFVAMAKDIRVILIKFSDRLHNITTLDSLPTNKQKRIALETLEIYAPIANRLGMGELKGQLEDAAFPYVLSKEHSWVVELVKQRVADDQKCIDQMITSLKEMLSHTSMKVWSIHGRMKHLYSLYVKLLENNKDISKIHDLVAIRVVVDTVSECYATLGLIHEKWKPLKGRIKDYIATPKPNGYQSLHTTVWGKDGRIVEIQIRTRKMHEEAEFGIAAHWHYKETLNKERPISTQERTAWINQLLKLHKDAKDEKEYLESLKLDIFHHRIFVFTPEGDVLDLPEGSTPVDFAYHIHTDIGNTCTGAKINEKIVPLETHLQSGDVVQILVDKNRRGPSTDWLKFVRTNTARNRIRAFAKKNKFNLNMILRHLIRKK